jgi:hypothetical protein
MKTRVFAVAAALVLAVLSLGSVAHAQNALVVNVPFDFAAGAATLPAGQYYVEQLSRGSVVMIKGISGQAAAAVAMTRPAEPKREQAKSVLVFKRYGEDYFLAEIWNAQEQNCLALTSARSRGKEQQLAKSGTPEQITLVAYAAPAK